jgi:glycosyltransferase involved in cell wall biosynthesis
VNPQTMPHESLCDTIRDKASRSGTFGAGRVRVLHVISGLFYGGGQRVVLDLLDSLPRMGDIEPTFCTLGEPQGQPLSDRVDFSIPYNGRYNDLRVLARGAWQLRRRLREGHWDILHTHGLDADLIGALAVCGQPVEHLAHLHISPPTQRESWKALLRRRLLRRLTLRNGSWFIAVSDAVRQEMARYYGFALDRIVTVRNGVDVDAFASGLTHKASTNIGGPVIIGTAGRLAPMKGFEHLIDAVSELRARDLDIQLRIAGTGSLLASLEARARDAGVSDRVRFCGHVSAMSEFYQQLDVFVLPSLSEGLPLTVLEAMASGLPVVATDVGGTAEALPDGVDGILVPPGDSVQLAEALSQLVASAEMREEMGRRAGQRAKSEFSRDRVAREVAAVYERMLSSSHAAVAAG